MKGWSSYLPMSLAIALFGFAPCLFSLTTNDPVQYPQMFGLATVSAILLIGYFVSARAPFALPHWIWWPMGAMVLLQAGSAAWALNPAESAFAAARWTLLLALLTLLQIALSQRKDTLILICKTLIISMPALAIVGILQWRGIDPLHLSDAYHSPNSLFANRNFFGSAMMLGLPFVGYAALKLAGGWRWMAMVAIVFMLLGILVSGARAALVPILLGAVLILPVVIWRRFSGSRRIWGLVTWVVVLALLGWSTKFFLKQKDAKFNLDYLTNASAQITPKSSSLDFRLICWNRTMQMAQDHPWTGVGAGNWKMHIQHYGLQSYDDAGRYGMIVPLHPHHEVLLAWAELGLPGLVLLLAIFGIGCGGALRMALRRDSGDPALGTMLVLGWLAFGVDASFSFPLERPFHLALLALLMALSMQGFSAQEWRPNAIRVLLALALAGALWTCIDVFARTGADAVVHAIRAAKEAHQPQKVLQLRPKATNWATQIDPVAALSVDWYVAMAHAELGQPQQALEAMERAALVSPHSFALRSGHAAMLDLNQRSTEAIAMQTELLQAYPTFAEGWLNLSIMQLHAGHWPDARRSLGHLAPSEFPDRYQQVDAALVQQGY